MYDTPSVGMTYLENERLKAQKHLEELRTRNELNDRIMTNVNWIVDKVSKRCDAVEVRGEIETLAKLLQIRKSRGSTAGVGLNC